MSTRIFLLVAEYLLSQWLHHFLNNHEVLHVPTIPLSTIIPLRTKAPHSTFNCFSLCLSSLIFQLTLTIFYFLFNRITTTIISPTPFIASDFVILGSIIFVLGTQYSRLSPIWCMSPLFHFLALIDLLISHNVTL